jgi:hypothetical protein
MSYDKSLKEVEKIFNKKLSVILSSNYSYRNGAGTFFVTVPTLPVHIGII